VFILWDDEDEVLQHPIDDLMSDDCVPFKMKVPASQSTFNKARLDELADLLPVVHPEFPDIINFRDMIRRCPNNQDMMDDLGRKLTVLLHGDQDEMIGQMQEMQSTVGYNTYENSSNLSSATSAPSSSTSISFDMPSSSSPQPPMLEPVKESSRPYEQFPPFSLCGDYPESSILKFYGKRQDRPICRGDIVERSDSWYHGDQDGGAGSRGLVDSVSDDGDRALVIWPNSMSRNYSFNDIKVVDRIKQINIGDIVERGPTWRFEHGDSDGGPGNVGIVSGFRNDKEIYVLWTSGRISNYRWGYATDVKILSSDAPREESGFGSSWTYIISAPAPVTSGVLTGDIKSSPLLKEPNNPTGQLFKGDFVIRGPHWRGSDEDGGNGLFGVVREDSAAGFVNVVWMSNKSDRRYAYGQNGAFEVSLVIFPCFGSLPFKHWTSRISSVPEGVSSGDLKCRHCGSSQDQLEKLKSYPFFCEDCKYCVCKTCYHAKQPPRTPLTPKFSLTQSKRIFTAMFGNADHKKLFDHLTDSEGDLLNALESYCQVSPLASQRAVICHPKLDPLPEKYMNLKQLLLNVLIREGSLDLLDAIIGRVDVNKLQREGRAALHDACLHGHLDIVECLLTQCSADSNLPDSVNDSPLAYCAQAGYVTIGEILVQHGALVNNVANNLLTPLLRAVLNKRTEMTEFLLEKGALVNVVDLNLRTACHTAVVVDSPRCLELLIKHDANIDMRDSIGFTPLHLCGKEFADRCAELLIAKGADLNIVDDSGKTALHIAACFDASSVVDHILNKDPALINVPDKNRNTPLHSACKLSQRSRLPEDQVSTRGEEAAQTLILRGADVNLMTDGDLEALHLAAASGMPRTIRLLVQNGVDVNKVAFKEQRLSSLHIACHHNKADVVNVLVELLADLDPRNNNGETPLFIACKEGNFECARILIERKADVNIADTITLKNPVHLGNEYIIFILESEREIF